MISLNKSSLGDMVAYYTLKCDLEEAENLRCEYMSIKCYQKCMNIIDKSIIHRSIYKPENKSNKKIYYQLIFDSLFMISLIPKMSHLKFTYKTVQQLKELSSHNWDLTCEYKSYMDMESGELLKLICYR